MDPLHLLMRVLSATTRRHVVDADAIDGLLLAVRRFY
ncbi:hypothetical protein SRABI83_01365 [Arthrobacter sp. Bi83]|nr:hypothetical protein SRABI83_01365 [Arthrobacter sp. Bi83]